MFEPARACDRDRNRPGAAGALTPADRIEVLGDPRGYAEAGRSPASVQRACRAQSPIAGVRAARTWSPGFEGRIHFEVRAARLLQELGHLPWGGDAEEAVETMMEDLGHEHAGA